jgi:hypothetical protein
MWRNPSLVVAGGVGVSGVGGVAALMTNLLLLLQVAIVIAAAARCGTPRVDKTSRDDEALVLPVLKNGGGLLSAPRLTGHTRARGPKNN